MAKRDYRSAEAQEYHKLYSLRIWRGTKKNKWEDGLRGQQLIKHPLCERCLKRKRLVTATVANHRIPHNGDWALFSDPSNLESTCAPCHNSEIQSEERLGFSKAIGADGFPLDEKHPFNRARTG